MTFQTLTGLNIVYDPSTCTVISGTQTDLPECPLKLTNATDATPWQLFFIQEGSWDLKSTQLVYNYPLSIAYELNMNMFTDEWGMNNMIVARTLPVYCCHSFNVVSAAHAQKAMAALNSA